MVQYPLKVLHIENQEQQHVSNRLKASQLEELPFVFTCIRWPEDAEQMLRIQREMISAQHGERDYDLSQLPFDVYLADLNLRDDSDNFSDFNAAQARYAEAAGLTTAALMACNFMQHPACIIPYTAYSTELEAPQYDLVKRLLPDTVLVDWEAEELISKNFNIQTQLPRISRQYREVIKVAARAGHVSIPYRELRRLLQQLCSSHELSEGTDEESTVIIPSDETIVMSTAWGCRRISLRAFWYDHDQGQHVDVCNLREWLDGFAPSSDELLAWQMAIRYFLLRQSEASWKRYQLSRALQSISKGKDGRNELIVKAICEEIGLDVHQVLNDPKHVGLPPNWKYPHLVSHPAIKDNDDILRLTILCLFICEEIIRHMRKEFQEEYELRLNQTLRLLLTLPCSEEGDNMADRILEILENREPITMSTVENTLTHLLTESGSFQHASEYEHWRKDMAQNEPLDGASIVRLLDPMPEQLLIDEELGKNTKIGKALVNLHPPFDLESLRHGGVPDINDAERQLAKRFAHELTAEQTLWPRWLKQ